MPTNSDIVAEGQLATTETSIYSPVSELVGGVLCLFCSGSNTQTVDIYLRKASGTSRHIYRGTLTQYQGAVMSGIHLGPSDDLRALTTNTASINYVLYGGYKT